mmetsp:Transcript_51218/g.76524  ORF Transcript_51218/g.76524 Transcript_51218/m.76524 type:complete len:80 (-) Transcript_51218:1393-1632(-)
MQILNHGCVCNKMSSNKTIRKHWPKTSHHEFWSSPWTLKNPDHRMDPKTRVQRADTEVHSMGAITFVMSGRGLDSGLDQ